MPFLASGLSNTQCSLSAWPSIPKKSLILLSAFVFSKIQMVLWRGKYLIRFHTSFLWIGRKEERSRYHPQTPPHYLKISKNYQLCECEAWTLLYRYVHLAFFRLYLHQISQELKPASPVEYPTLKDVCIYQVLDIVLPIKDRFHFRQSLTSAF